MVQTGVKSFGCENSTAQLSPIHSWKSISPSVVCARKLGASSLMRNDIGFSCWMATCGRLVLQRTSTDLYLSATIGKYENRTFLLGCLQIHKESAAIALGIDRKVHLLATYSSSLSRK